MDDEALFQTARLVASALSYAPETFRRFRLRIKHSPPARRAFFSLSSPPFFCFLSPFSLSSHPFFCPLPLVAWRQFHRDGPLQVLRGVRPQSGHLHTLLDGITRTVTYRAPPSCAGSATPGLIRTLPTATRSSGGSAAARLEGKATAAVVARRTPLRPRTHWDGRCGIDRACAAAAMMASMRARPRNALHWRCLCRGHQAI